MKTIFFVQDFAFNKRINYYHIKKTLNNNLYLIAYNVTQQLFDEYVQNSYQDTFVECLAIDILDEDVIRNIITSFTKKHGNDILIITNAESAVSACGRLRQSFGIDNDNLVRYVDKIEMKTALENKIRMPKYVQFSNEDYLNDPDLYYNKIIDFLGAAIFIKPTNQYSSRGTKKLTNIEDLKEWHSNYQDDFNHVEVDELIEGTLYQCDSFIKDGKILYTHVCEYINPCHEFVLGKPFGSITLPRDSKDFKVLGKYNATVLKQLGAPHGGMTHLEVFKTKEGELVFLEIAARPAGAQTPQVYQKALNLDSSIREAHILLQTDPDYSPNIEQIGHACFISYPKKQGSVTLLNTPDKDLIQSEYICDWLVKVGDTLKDADKISDVALNIILWNNDYNQLQQDVDYLKTFTPFIVSNETKLPKIEVNIESGNFVVQTITKDQIIGEIKKDSNNKDFQWFYFILEGENHSAIKIIIKNVVASSYPAAWENYQVCIRHDGADSWHTVNTKLEHNDLVFTINLNNSKCEIAYFIPYTLKQHQNLNERFSSLNVCKNQFAVLANNKVAVQGFYLSSDETRNRKNNIWIIARQHSGESIVGWFMEGILETLESNSNLSREILNKYNLVIVPNANPAGVNEGNHRTNATGYDLNRSWLNPDPSSCPEISTIIEWMHLHQPKLVLDIHGDERTPHPYVLINPGTVSDHEQQLLNKLATNCSNLEIRHQLVNNIDLSIGRHYVHHKFNCLALTFELPCQCFSTNISTPISLTNAAKKLAKECLITFAQY